MKTKIGVLFGVLLVAVCVGGPSWGACPPKVIRFVAHYGTKVFKLGVSPSVPSTWRQDKWKHALSLLILHDPETCRDRLQISLERWYWDKRIKVVDVAEGTPISISPGTDVELDDFGNDATPMVFEIAR